ncbi:hypothetical protein WEI85_00100 [Actinomycetes bacterium KLBMP 9797]
MASTHTPPPPQPSAAATGVRDPGLAAPTAGHGELLIPARRWPLVLNRAAGVLLVLACAAAAVTVTLSWPGPVDAAWTLLIACCVAALICVMGMPWRYLVAPMPPVRLTTDGIDTGSAVVPWAELIGVETVWAAGTGRLVSLRRRDGRTVPLWSLTGPLWPDPHFHANLSRLVRVAGSRNASIRVWRRNLALLTTAAVAVLLLPAATSRAYQHGLVGPWSPAAPTHTAACALLADGPAHTFWPGELTVRSGSFDDHRSYCTWETMPARAAETPLDRMTLSATVHGWQALHSPVAVAAHAHIVHIGTMVAAQPLLGMPTDDAVIATGRMSVLVAARRANVTITAEVACIASAGCPLYAQHIAGQVAYWALLGIPT